MIESEHNISRVAAEIHVKYSKQVGSDQIAQKAGLELIGRLIEENDFSKFLEIGSGIGTIAEFILQLRAAKSTTFTCFERDSWCQEKLDENLMPYQYDVLTNESQLLSFSQEIDLLIIDDLISRQETEILIKNSNPKMIFVEGHRRKQRLDILLSSRRLGRKLKFKNYRKTSDSYKLGCTFEYSFEGSNYSYAFVFVYFSLIYSKVIELRSKVSFRRLLRIT